MARSGSDPDDRIDDLLRVIDQVKQQIGSMESQHSRSVSQGVQPVQKEVGRLKAELEKTQGRLNSLEIDFHKFQEKERARTRQHEARDRGTQNR